MSTFCGMNCFCRELSDELATNGSLPLDLSIAVAEQVTPGKYTRLVLCDEFGCEIIRVVNKDGEICIEGRGEEGTTPRAWNKGSTIKFDWTVENMDDWYQCKREIETSDDDDAPIKSEYFTVTPPENEGDPWCIEPPESEAEDEFGAFEFTVCGFRYFLKDGVWCRTPLPASQTQPDGLYSSPDVFIKDGCPIFRKSANSLAAKSGCCSCGKDSLEPNKTETEPATDGSAGYLWVKPSDGCVSILCDGVWYGIGTRVG